MRKEYAHRKYRQKVKLGYGAEGADKNNPLPDCGPREGLAMEAHEASELDSQKKQEEKGSLEPNSPRRDRMAPGNVSPSDTDKRGY